LSSRRLISSGSSFERDYGYSRGLVQDGWIFLAGCTGFDYARGTIADDPAEQARQVVRNIEAALGQAGAGLADIVKVTTYLADRAIVPIVLPIWGAAMRDIRPPNTAVIAQMIDPRMLVEIDVTARQRKE